MLKKRKRRKNQLKTFPKDLRCIQVVAEYSQMYVCAYGMKLVFKMWMAGSVTQIWDASPSSRKWQMINLKLFKNRWEFGKTKENRNIASPLIFLLMPQMPPWLCCFLFLPDDLCIPGPWSIESLPWTHFFLPGDINRPMTPYALCSLCIIHTVHLLSRSQSF